MPVGAGEGEHKNRDRPLENVVNNNRFTVESYRDS